MGIPVQILQEQVSSTDFLDMIKYTEELEWNERTKMEYYAANIITEIQRSFVKPEVARKLTTEKSLIKFVFSKAKKLLSLSALTPKEKADKAARSKRIWLWSLGLSHITEEEERKKKEQEEKEF